jgi:hypothetical protein
LRRGCELRLPLSDNAPALLAKVIIVSTTSSTSGNHMQLNKVASIAIGTTPTPAIKIPMNAAMNPQSTRVSRRPCIHSVTPNRYHPILSVKVAE